MLLIAAKARLVATISCCIVVEEGVVPPVSDDPHALRELLLPNAAKLP